MSNWTKDHTGQYSTTLNGDTFIARKVSNGWQLLIVDPMAVTGETWCQSYATFTAIKYDISKA